MPGYWVWGASAVAGPDGRWHLFASRWPKSVSFFHWATRSEIIRATADRPEGPYQYAETVLGPRDPACWDGQVTHNPAIRFHRGKYLLFYVGCTYRGAQPQQAGEGGLFSPQWVEAWNHKRIGMAVADSPEGPWERPDQPLLLPRPGKWDAAITSNPAPCLLEDGRVLMIYKSARVPHPEGPYPERFHLGMAHADHWSQPFQRLLETPLALSSHPDHHLEDAFLWREENHFALIAKDMTGELTGEAQAGIHATSPDGRSWRLSNPPRAYSKTVALVDGTKRLFKKRERPQLLLQGGKPTHLFTAVMEANDSGDITDSWNLVARME